MVRRMMNEDQSINLTVWALMIRFAEHQDDATLHSHTSESGRRTPAGPAVTLKVMAKDCSGRHRCYGLQRPVHRSGTGTVISMESLHGKLT